MITRHDVAALNDADPAFVKLLELYRSAHATRQAYVRSETHELQVVKDNALFEGGMAVYVSGLGGDFNDAYRRTQHALDTAALDAVDVEDAADADIHKDLSEGRI